eukprot:1176557-Prorocentrum_minimum.AAC.3
MPRHSFSSASRTRPKALRPVRLTWCAPIGGTSQALVDAPYAPSDTCSPHLSFFLLCSVSFTL